MCNLQMGSTTNQLPPTCMPGVLQKLNNYVDELSRREGPPQPANLTFYVRDKKGAGLRCVPPALPRWVGCSPGF